MLRIRILQRTAKRIICLLETGQAEHAALGARAKAGRYQDFVLLHLCEYRQPFVFAKAQLGVVPAMHDFVYDAFIGNRAAF